MKAGDSQISLRENVSCLAGNYGKDGLPGGRGFSILLFFKKVNFNKTSKTLPERTQVFIGEGKLSQTEVK